MPSYVLKLDGLDLIQGNKLRVFKSQEELAAFLIIIASKHPDWHLDVKEVTENLDLNLNKIKSGKKLHI